MNGWVRGLLALALAIAFTGCAPHATYPREEGVMDLSGAKLEPIPELMTKAIRHAHRSFGTAGADFAINLPPGTPAEVYEDVIDALGGGRPMTDPAEPAYHVDAVRVRGLSAEVDLFHPRSGTDETLYEFVTINFKRKLGGYEVESTRLWRIRHTAPAPNYGSQERLTTERRRSEEVNR